MRNEAVCQDAVEGLLEYVEGLLAPEMAARIDSHRAVCPRCREFIESYLATPRVLRGGLAGSMPAAMKARLADALKAR